MLSDLITLIQKDFRLIIRSSVHLFSVVLFGVLLLLLFSFSMGGDIDLLRKSAAGLFWITVFFSSTFFLDQSLQYEQKDGRIEGLLLLGVDPKIYYVSKTFSNFLLLILVEFFLLFPLIVLFDVPFSWSMLTVLIMGSFGISALGTAYAGVTTSLVSGNVLLPLLLYPMLIPLLLAGVQATQLCITGDLFNERFMWYSLLAIFDVVFFVAAFLCAPFLFDKSS
ncbi:MAG: heme exporter protein CcmB [Deltaproteobacteria bacterium]|nr:heme exporter protein CcmB [Deltaproteobacteria bacterium]